MITDLLVNHQQQDNALGFLLIVIVLMLIVSAVSWWMAYSPRRVRNVRRRHATPVHFDHGYTSSADVPVLSLHALPRQRIAEIEPRRAAFDAQRERDEARHLMFVVGGSSREIH